MLLKITVSICTVLFIKFGIINKFYGMLNWIVLSDHIIIIYVITEHNNCYKVL